jgi:hypothetical protein
MISPPSGSGGIIRSKIGRKCVDLILIRLAKCWNYFFSSKFCIWLYCVKSEYRWVYCFTSVRRPSKIFFITFFSATIDGKNLIFGHKLHIGMPYRGEVLELFFFFKILYMIILCQVGIYFFLLSSQIFFFKTQNQNNF